MIPTVDIFLKLCNVISVMITNKYMIAKLTN